MFFIMGMNWIMGLGMMMIDDDDDRSTRSGGNLDLFVKNEQKLNCVSLGDWSSIGDAGGDHNVSDENGDDDLDNSGDDNAPYDNSGLSVEDIEHHIQKLIQ